MQSMHYTEEADSISLQMRKCLPSPYIYIYIDRVCDLQSMQSAEYGEYAICRVFDLQSMQSMSGMQSLQYAEYTAYRGGRLLLSAEERVSAVSI